MKVLSLFSGVGGFDLGLERAGMETVFQCEWDKHAVKILEKHWPDVPRWDDVSTLTGEHILRHAPVIDVVAWGSPCQDLSVAGKRAGLEGARSGLFHEGVRIIKELRELTNGKYPRISVWENVAGALSSGKGADFGQVLTEMDEAGACFSEWRILDAQYFGVPQRRRRVFLVSVFDPATAARCPDPLLPVSESVRRDTQESATTRQESANEIASCLRVGSGVGERGDGSDNLVTTGLGSGGEVANTISASLYHHGTVVNQDANNGHVVVDEPPILIDRGAFNQGKNALYQPIISDSPVVPSLVARGPHAVFTKGKRAQTPTDDETWDEGRPAPTLNQFDQGDTRATTIIAIQGNVIGRQDHNGPAGKGHTDDGDPMFTLTSTDIHAVATLMTMREGKPGGGKGPLLSQDKSLSLSTSNEQTLFQPHAIAFQPGTMIRMSGGVWDELAPTLRAEAKRGDNEPHVIQYDGYNQKIHVDEPSVTLRIGRDSSDFVAQPVESAGFKPGASAGARTIGYEEELSPSLEAGGGGNNKPAVMTPTMAVRRLTPLECERLMGWPDDWTAGQSDTHRYKQCGNGVASPVATWIGQQLMELDQ